MNNGRGNSSSRNIRTGSAGRIVSGILVITAGVLLLGQKLGADVPEWIFTWQMLVIAVGLYFGAKCGFRRLGWLLPVVFGGIMLADEFIIDINIQAFIWPIVIILAGLLLIFKPRRKHCRRQYQGDERNYFDETGSTTSENVLDITSVFGGIKRTIVTSQFKGGEINCVFGGAEIDLSQSDIKGVITLEANQVFGGTKLIIPPHWQVQSEVTAVMGGIEDKRRTPSEGTDPDKVMILKGTCLLGGMEINSY